jgi:hypothetical protein
MSETSDWRPGAAWGYALGRGARSGLTAVDSGRPLQPRGVRAARLLLPLTLLVALLVGACKSQPATPVPTDTPVNTATLSVVYNGSPGYVDCPSWTYAFNRGGNALIGGGWVLIGGGSRVSGDYFSTRPDGYAVLEAPGSTGPVYAFALCLTSAPNVGWAYHASTADYLKSTIPPRIPFYMKAQCSPGEVVMGGGFDVTPGLVPDATVFESAPEPNGWSVGVIHHTDMGGNLYSKSWVTCAQVNLHTVINSTTFTVPAGRGATGTATCKDKSASLLSGGYSMDPQSQVDITASTPALPSGLPSMVPLTPVAIPDYAGSVDHWTVRAVSHDTIDRVVTIAVVCGTLFVPPTPTPTRTPLTTPTLAPTVPLPTLVPAPWVVIGAPVPPGTTFTDVAPPGQQVHLSGGGSSYVTQFVWTDSINGGPEVPLGVGPDLDVVLPLASTANCAITDHQIWLAGSTSDGQAARYTTDVKLEAPCVP